MNKKRNKRFATVLLGVIGFLLLVVPVEAERIEMKSGRVVSGEILEVTEETVRFRQQTDSGFATVTLQLDRVAPLSVYRLRTNHQNLSTARDRFHLARFLLQNELFEQAHRELDRAEQLAEKESMLQEIENLRTEANTMEAERLLREGRQFMEEENWGVALDRFQSILSTFSGIEAVEQAEDEVAEINERLEEERTRLEEQEDLERSEAVFQRIELYIQEGRNNLSRGYRRASERNDRGALLDYRRARSRFNSALYFANQHLEEGSIENRARLRELRNNARTWMIRSLNSQTTHFAKRGQLREAYRAANEALSLDPSNVEAQELKRMLTEHSLRQQLPW